MDEITTFAVYRENTFGYIRGDMDKAFLRLWVIAVDYMRGGEPLDINGVKLVNKSDIRVATLSDFNYFRISSKGYIDNPMYVIGK